MATQVRLFVREYPGAQPGSFGLLEKTGNTAATMFERLHRANEDFSDRLININQATQVRSRAKWEVQTQKQLEDAKVTRLVNARLREHEVQLMQRRERLKDLLEREEVGYIREMENRRETPMDRQLRMRNEALHLRHEREEVRRKLCEEKLDQQFRERSEELRAKLTKKHTIDCSNERQEQIRMKEELDKERAAEEVMWTRLYEEDRLAKERREERDAQVRAEKTREMMGIIAQQTAELEKRKVEERALKAEEGKLIDEWKRVERMEKEREQADKQRRDRETRELYERSMRLRLVRKSKQAQEDLEFELKMLAKIQEESDRERVEALHRKKELNEEYARYREYLKRELEEEKLREQELDRLCDIEIEKTFQKRAEIHAKERERKRKIMEQITEGLKQQIQERMVENAKEQEASRIESLRIREQIERNLQLEREEQASRQLKQRVYGEDLRGQIQFNSQTRVVEQDERLRELEKYREAEEEYQRKVKEVLAREYAEPQHPLRMALSAQRRLNSLH